MIAAMRRASVLLALLCLAGGGLPAGAEEPAAEAIVEAVLEWEPGRLGPYAAMFVDGVPEDELIRSYPAGDTGRLPGGRLGTTALRILAMQNGEREQTLSVLVK